MIRKKQGNFPVSVLKKWPLVIWCVFKLYIHQIHTK